MAFIFPILLIVAAAKRLRGGVICLFTNRGRRCQLPEFLGKLLRLACFVCEIFITIAGRVNGARIFRGHNHHVLASPRQLLLLFCRLPQESVSAIEVITGQHSVLFWSLRIARHLLQLSLRVMTVRRNLRGHTARISHTCKSK